MESEGRQWLHIDVATTLPVAKDIVPLHDALRATEKALGEAEWEGLDTTYLKQEIASLRLAQRVGEKYVTNW